jgi:hypothetical protein
MIAESVMRSNAAYALLPGSRGKMTLRSERSTLAVCKSMVISTIMLSRFAIPLGGDKQVPVSFVVGLLHLAVIAVLTGCAFSPRRLMATALVILVVLFETFLVHRHFSALSVAYVFAIYLPLALSTNLAPRIYMKKLWDSFISMATLLGILALVQVALQVARPGFFLDPISLVPERFLLSNYNTTYPVLRGVLELLKPNGMFTVEPSFLSQILGLGLLGELIYRRRLMRIVLLGASLISAFSGTGLLIVLVSLFFLSNPRAILATVLVAAAAAELVNVSGYGEAFASRTSELSHPGTSGHERFVAPFTAISDSWSESVPIALFGHGAGQVTAIDNGLDANYSAIPKVAIEYGILGLAAFALMWISMFAGLAMHRALVVALLLYYLIVSGALLQPFTVFSLWGLALGFARKRSAPGNARVQAA